MNIDIFIALSLLLVGFLYASVGHGGASGYLAVLSIFGIPVTVYSPFILLLNIVVASLSFSQYYKKGYFIWKLTWPFLLTSIPFAFLGAQIYLQKEYYNLLLGLALWFPIVKLLGFAPINKQSYHRVNLVYALTFGAVIGFLSGLLNIGGGIFLSPVIILMAWADSKQAATSAALFIVLNSLAGLAGKIPNFSFLTYTHYIWFTAAIIGGAAGAVLGSHKFAINTVRYLLVVVLSIASFKLVFF
ncbi:MAG: sulfite exporter TauE/SafE family protein [Sphingobacteriales bacterium]|nr:MAG: sulfite exporter TauE/SafE family protein [Sphingobacteriales bacterium]TAF78645.1 MAG: sulfite exporter TauE/SafE family protein [Sphingobacteriales bacterium]